MAVFPLVRHRQLLTAAVLLCALQGFKLSSGAPLNIHSGRDLQRALVWTRSAQDGCVRLLNATGVVGCASGPVEAPLLTINSSTIPQITEPRVLLVNSSWLPAVLYELDRQPNANVAGVIVLPGGAGNQNFDSQQPQAAFAPYKDQYAWNRGGNGGLWRQRQFPVQVLDKESVADILTKAQENTVKEYSGAVHVALLDASMHGCHNSSMCLADGQCDPLGGHSVWASLPSFHSIPAQTRLPILLVAAEMNGMGLIHENVVGVDAPLSGLIAMLAAAELLGSQQQLSYNRRIVFAAFAGEGWGYMGSKRFLWDLSTGANSTEGLDLAAIEQVVEIGHVGRARNATDGRPQFFFHSQKGAEFGDPSQLWNAVDFVAKKAHGAAVSKASSSAPGIPPSSLTSFLRANSSIAGAVLAEFDAAFSDPYYATEFDGLDGVNAAGIVSAAVVVARTLARLAAGMEVLQVDPGKVSTTVNNLLECFGKKGALLACPLAKDLITRTGMSSNYIGVLHTLTPDSQDPNIYVKNDMSRFLWNFLAEATSNGSGRLASGEAGGCDPQQHVCEEGAVCVGFRVDKQRAEDNGRCRFATTKYVAAVSTRIDCKECDGRSWGRWVQTDASTQWEAALGWPADPVWTESRWDEGIPRMELFQKEDLQTEDRVLVAGIAVTAAAALLVYSARAVHSHRLKQL